MKPGQGSLALGLGAAMEETQDPEPVMELGKDGGRSKKKGASSKEFQSASCRQPNRNWEGGMEEGAETIS